MAARTPVYRSSALLLIAATVLATGARAELSPAPGAARLDLLGYVDLAVQRSERAHDIEDDLFARELALERARIEFDTRVVPLANVSVGDSSDTRRIGVEVTRKSEAGTTFATGVESSEVDSSTFEVLNPFNTRAYVRVSQGLLRGWGTRYNRAILTTAELNRSRDTLLAQRRRQDLLLEAVLRFHSAWLAIQSVTGAEQALARSQRHGEAALSRHNVGLVPKVDVYRAELASLDAENRLKDRERGARRELESLHELLSLAGVDHYWPSLQIKRWQPLLPTDWSEALLQRRVEWQAWLLDREAGDLRLYRAQKQTSPDLQLSLQLEQEGFGESHGESTTLDEQEWSVLLSYRTSLERAEEHNALAQERLSRSRLARAGRVIKRRIERDAREALADLEAAARRYDIATRQLDQADKARELSAIRYRRGLSTSAEVLDTEEAYTQAQLDSLQSLVAYNSSVARLGHALGVISRTWLASLTAPADAARIE